MYRFGLIVPTMDQDSTVLVKRLMISCQLNTSKQHWHLTPVLCTQELATWALLRNLTRPLQMEVSNISIISIVTMSSLAYYDSLFVVGSRDEAMNIRGLRYHPVDIESSVVRCHKNIVERYAIHFVVSSLRHCIQCCVYMDKTIGYCG